MMVTLMLTIIVMTIVFWLASKAVETTRVIHV